MAENKKTGGVHARIGSKFHKEVEEIVTARLQNGKDKIPIAIEKVTNLIASHKKFKDIREEIENATKEEVEAHGSE